MFAHGDFLILSIHKYSFAGVSLSSLKSMQRGSDVGSSSIKYDLAFSITPIKEVAVAKMDNIHEATFLTQSGLKPTDGFADSHPVIVVVKVTCQIGNGEG